MQERTRRRLIIGGLLGIGVVAGFLWMMDDRFTPRVPPPPAVDTASPPPESSGTVRVEPLPPADTASRPVTVPSDSVPVPSPYDPPGPPPVTGGTVPRTLTTGKLLIPVAGVRPDQLLDTYADARSEGRVHNAIDIIAPRNAPVLAATDGYIVKLFQSERGGITIYQLGTDSSTIFYYAHLDRYADSLAEGTFARRGDLIGYVGDSGNAGAGNYHLHFAIWVVTDPRRYWEGVDINPYPLLRGEP